MKADEFVNKISKIREDNFNIDFTTIFDRGNNEEMSPEKIREYLIRNCYSGSLIIKNEYINAKYKNELENLVLNYTYEDMYTMLRFSILKECIILTEELTAIGEIDNYICINKSGEITWNDFDTYEEVCSCAISSEAFIDCMFAIAYNRFYLELGKEELLEKLIILSKTENSRMFYSYVLAIY